MGVAKGVEEVAFGGGNTGGGIYATVFGFHDRGTHNGYTGGMTRNRGVIKRGIGGGAEKVEGTSGTGSFGTGVE